MPTVPTWLLGLLMDVLPQIPTLVQDGKNIFAEMASDEDGHKKIAGIISGLSHLTNHAATAIVDHSGPTQATTAPGDNAA